jgi:phage shock protein A
MGIFKRMADIFKANINDLINKAEDPAKMLDQIIAEMQENLRDAKIQVAKAIADEKRLKQQLDQNTSQVQSWESKAVLALQKGDEELAKEALKRKKSYADIATTIEPQWKDQSNIANKLKDSLRALESKIDEARRKKEVLIARQKRAEAQKKIQEVMTGMSDTSAFDNFARMERKVEEIEAQAAAAVEIESNTMEDKFKALEASADVDDELQALKAKLALKGGNPESESKA